MKKNDLMEMVDLYLNVLSENNILSLFVVIYLGLIFGSLMNVLSSRMVMMENINNIGIAKSIGKVSDKKLNSYFNKYKDYNLFNPKSSCPICDYKIKWWQNIPVLGYILLRGKCYSCKSTISLEYPIVELFITVLFVTLFYIFGLSVEFITYTILFYLLTLHILTDIKEKILFDSVTLIIFMVLTFQLLATGDLFLIKNSLISAFSVYIIMYSLIYVYEKLRGIEYSFGRGDIKLIAVLSIPFNLDQLLSFILIATFIGFVFFAALYLLKIKDKEIPFAPAIILSFVVNLIV